MRLYISIPKHDDNHLQKSDSNVYGFFYRESVYDNPKKYKNDLIGNWIIGWVMEVKNV